MAKQVIEPIKRSTLSSVVTERLRDLVTSGNYEPGAQISEVELADQFGVSRGPIREGLQRLVQEGLLRSEPHRGVFVPVMGNDDVADIYLARDAIETAALRVVANREQGKLLVEPLRGLVAEMDRAAVAEDWSTVAEIDMRFHRAVVDAAGSPRLSRMYATLVGETRSLLSITAAYPGRENLVEEHAEIARLIEAGDMEGAIASLARHFATSRDVLQSRASIPPPPIAESRSA